MSRYMPTERQRSQIDALRLAGYAVVRQATYDRLRKRADAAADAYASLAARTADLAAQVARAQRVLDRIIALHSQPSDDGLAPGKWCPACGDETPCRTIKATLTPPEYLGHLSREELRQRAMDYDEAEETALRRRESPDPRTHGLNHAPLPDGVWLARGFCAGCDESAALSPAQPDTERWGRS